MVKAKVLKTLRKKVEKAYRLDISEVIGPGSPSVRIDKKPDNDSDSNRLSPTEGIGNDEFASDDHDSTQQEPEKVQDLSIHFCSSSDLSDGILKSCMDIFERNMGDLYSNSSWGLDLEEKLRDFTHKQSRFLLVFDNNNENANDSAVLSLVAYLNFRFCLDDDQHPEYAVLYVYEVQVESAYRKAGIGRRLMALAETLAVASEMDKTMLTVFVSNTGAMTFYKRLGYSEDESSPRRNGDLSADYEILSKKPNGSATKKSSILPHLLL